MSRPVDIQGPPPERVPPSAAAGYLALRLHDQTSSRPGRRPRPVSPKKAAPRAKTNLEMLTGRMRQVLKESADIDKLDAIVSSESYQKMPFGLRRDLLKALTHVSQLDDLGRFVELAGTLELAKRELVLVVDTFIAALADGPGRQAYLTWLGSAMFKDAKANTRMSILQWTQGPKALQQSWSGQQNNLDTWWQRRRLELIRLVEIYDEQPGDPEALVSEFLHGARRPLYILTSPAFPGALIICLGDPAETTSLAYVRVFFLDEKRRLRVTLKCPVDPIRTGWRGQNKTHGAEYRYRRMMMTSAEELAFVRWLEENHLISGAKETASPSVANKALYEGLIQLDVRVPRTLNLICSNRGEIVFDEGRMVRGRPVEPQRALPKAA